VICGSAEALKESSGRWSAVWSVTDRDQKNLTSENIALGEPMINARLFRKSSFEKLGGFSLEYSLASDRDFLLRAVETGMVQCQVDSLTYRYRWHAGSSTMTEGNELTSKLSQENLAIAKTHLSRASSTSKRALLRWHDRLTVQAAMNALERLDLGFFGIATEGVGNNPAWGLLVVREVLRCFPGFIKRGFKTKTQRHVAEARQGHPQ